MKPARVLLAAFCAAVTIAGFCVCLYQGEVLEALGALLLGSYAAAVAWPWGDEA